MNKKKVKFGILVFIVVSILLLSLVANVFLAPNVFTKGIEDGYLLVYENTTFDELVDQLTEKTRVKKINTFKQTARAMKFTNVKSGRYKIVNSMNNITVVRMLRNGNQTPVQLTFNNIRTKEQLASRLSQQLMPDSTEILLLLNDTAFLSKYGVNPYTSVSLFLPNTYEMFWNVKAERIFERMHREYEKFWNDVRKQKAAAIPLSQDQVSTLASIVDSESNVVSEKPIIAGLYLNRLKKNMPLQADPTVIFAVGEFSIRRVLHEHLRIESPYNTYRNTGLPPGPIRIPTLSGLDAVLNFDKNDYIFMCAKETLNGEHNFAATWAEHRINAAKYQKALNERGIR